MKEIRTQVSRTIPAATATLYAILADYLDAHPAILPRPYFGDLTVIAGGYGAGTEFRLEMNVMGRTFHYQMDVTEPEPGRVIKETDHNTGQWSSFTLEPLGAGKTLVTIASVQTGRSGPAGWIEKQLVQFMSRRMFQKELALLADYAAGR